MSARAPTRRRPASVPQRGFVLVTGLLFLVVLTLLGLSLFRSTGVMDHISANTRDKQRSFESAQSALTYAEWTLTNGGGGVGTLCSGLASGDAVVNVHPCSNPLPLDPTTTVPFTNAFTYTPPGLVLGAANTPGGLNGTDVLYSGLPGFFIEYLGLSADGLKQTYQVTAYGSGGSADSVSVVRSTYSVQSGVKAVDGL